MSKWPLKRIVFLLVFLAWVHPLHLDAIGDGQTIGMGVAHSPGPLKEC